jgi:general secretion pathway protein E
VAVLRLPYAFARASRLVLLAETDKEIEVLAAPGADLAALGEIRRCFGKPLAVNTVELPLFERHLAEVYSQGDQTAAEVADDIGQDLDLARLVEEMPPLEDLLDSQHDAPVIRMINALLTQAVREGASDIHVEPFERHSVVRFRLDGALRDVVQPNRALHAALVSRVKIMAHLDIAEKRLPQDGRIGVRIAGRPVDVRVSTLPTHHGERVVMRLLDKSSIRLDLATLGMAADTLERVDELIRQPHGILLVTGPTGSGKTTTLYAALSRLDSAQQNIMTVEDPVEYDLPGVAQIQVNSRVDLDFARALRSILRQDPDVVMIGEIRDLETAQIAVQASLTGHLVLATLHTNDAASAVTRLVDMGVEPFLLSSSLLAVVAQRLVRRLCPSCKTPVAESGYHAEACPKCLQSGYQGRSGIYELLEMSDNLRRLVHDRASEADLRAAGLAEGRLRLLRDDGMRHVLAGQTSLEELLRVTRD